MQKPETNEYDPYYDTYISLVTEPDLISVLKGQPAELNDLLGGLDEEKGKFAYASGKWTIKESISHVIDAERIFAYRALRISRGDTTPIAAFEQDGYIENSHANKRSFSDLLGEFGELRSANVRLLRNLDDDGWKRMGTASESPVSVRALGFIMAGHVRHHCRILTERYLV